MRSLNPALILDSGRKPEEGKTQEQAKTQTQEEHVSIHKSD